MSKGSVMLYGGGSSDSFVAQLFSGSQGETKTISRSGTYMIAVASNSGTNGSAESHISVTTTGTVKSYKFFQKIKTSYSAWGCYYIINCSAGDTITCASLSNDRFQYGIFDIGNLSVDSYLIGKDEPVSEVISFKTAWVISVCNVSINISSNGYYFNQIVGLIGIAYIMNLNGSSQTFVTTGGVSYGASMMVVLK